MNGYIAIEEATAVPGIEADPDPQRAVDNPGEVTTPEGSWGSRGTAGRNPGVASFEGVALNIRGNSSGDLDTTARSAEVLARSPRPIPRAFGADSYGRALLTAG